MWYNQQLSMGRGPKGERMNLRKKIFAAFIIMILTPGIMIGGIGFIALNIGMKDFKTKGLRNWSVISQPLHALTELTQSDYNELNTAMAVYPERFENEEWLDSINDRLTGKFSYLVVGKKGEITYIGETDEFARVKERVMNAIAEREGAFDGAVYVNGSNPVLIKHRSMVFMDGTPFYFIIVSDVSAMVNRLTRSLVTGILLGVAAVAATATVLILWLNDCIVRPLEAVRLATRRIGEGDLNFKLQREQNDEIGQLCNDFEEMRRHLKTQIDQREQYEQDVREMISNVSHDLKTPLTAIKGYAEGMLDGVADTKERQAKYLKTIMVKATDMTLLVDELSFYAKLDNNKLPYNFERVNAVSYFRDCVEEYAEELELKDFTVKFVSAVPDDCEVVIDCEQMRRVMNNLIGNAVKYRNNDIHGCIDVKLTDCEDSVRVSVIDNGIGISKEAQPHIFERFYRADKSRTSGRAGTGIGLAIVDKIVKEHKGRVFVKSELGKGTTISFTVKKGAQQTNG